MKTIKDYIINEGEDVRWFPEDHRIYDEDSLIDMILDLFQSSQTAIDKLCEAVNGEWIDIKSLTSDKFLNKFGKLLTEIVKQESK